MAELRHLVVVLGDQLDPEADTKRKAGHRTPLFVDDILFLISLLH